MPLTAEAIIETDGGSGRPLPTLIRHLRVLRAVGEAVNSSLDLEQVLERSLEAVTQVTGYEISSLHLVSADGAHLVLQGDRGLSERLREINRVLPMGAGLIGGVAASGIPRRLREVARAKDLLPAAREAVAADAIRAFVCVPIRARHRILGTLSLGRRTEHRFSSAELHLLECVADQVGLALDNARLHSESRHQLQELERTRSATVRAERLSAVDGLAAGVAHEINNPLTIILGQVHVLVQGEPTAAAVLQGLAVIDAAARRAARIVKDLRRFAEPSPAHRSPCCVATEIRSLLGQEAPRLEAAGIAIRLELGEAPVIWGDAAQLRQVLAHLVDNARHAMAAAHGCGTLGVRLAPLPRGVRVEVADDGPGIAPEHLPRIFNPFFTTKGPDEGRGLGLSVSYGIVKEHGGRLWAENLPGGGALFVVELPVSLRRVERAPRA
ncbi:MAG: GAF domain-containing protein [Candidatus Rokubacteria bacterium]|nr:GAF domain-containing protein [Candidatus Rokubacteria bacterium]